MLQFIVCFINDKDSDDEIPDTDIFVAVVPSFNI